MILKRFWFWCLVFFSIRLGIIVFQHYDDIAFDIKYDIGKHFIDSNYAALNACKDDHPPTPDCIIHAYHVLWWIKYVEELRNAHFKHLPEIHKPHTETI